MIKKLKEARVDPLQKDFLDLVPKSFTEEVQFLIDEAEQKGIDLKKYITIDHSLVQVSEILLGLENKVDVTKYNDIKLTYKQMQEVRLGLERGVDLTFFDIVPYSNGELKEIRLALQNGVSKDSVKKHMLKVHNYKELQKIRKQLEKGPSENLKENWNVIDNISDVELEKIMDEILTGPCNLVKDDKGNYRTEMYADYSDRLDNTTIEKALDEGWEYFTDQMIESYENVQSECFDEIFKSCVKELERNNYEYHESNLVDFLQDKVCIDYPWEHYNQKFYAMLFLGTKEDENSKYTLIPATEDLEGKHACFKSGSILAILANTQGASLRDLNALTEKTKLTKCQFLIDLWEAYFSETVYDNMDRIAIVAEINLYDALDILFPRYRESEIKRFSIDKCKIIICDQSKEYISYPITINRKLELPISAIKGIQVTREDITCKVINFLK